MSEQVEEFKRFFKYTELSADVARVRARLALGYEEGIEAKLVAYLEALQLYRGSKEAMSYSVIEIPKLELADAFLKALDFPTSPGIQEPPQREPKITTKAAPVKRQGYIYVLKAELGNYHKIGRTNNPKNRLAMLGVQMPFPVEPAHIAAVDDMYEAEAYLHEFFSDKRAYGEWFELDPEDLEIIREEYPAAVEVA
jgi:hypothetical protein